MLKSCHNVAHSSHLSKISKLHPSEDRKLHLIMKFRIDLIENQWCQIDQQPNWLPKLLLKTWSSKMILKLVMLMILVQSIKTCQNQKKNQKFQRMTKSRSSTTLLSKTMIYWEQMCQCDYLGESLIRLRFNLNLIFYQFDVSH